MDKGFTFACPVCRRPLEQLIFNERRCSCSCVIYRHVDGIWRFLPPEREEYYSQFIEEYETVRRAEGRGSSDPAYYRALPFTNLGSQLGEDWRIRAISYQALVKQVVLDIERTLGRHLRMIDLGAGNGWLSYRMAKRGHKLMAVDLMTNAWDGLGAFIHYDSIFTPIQAEFNHLPLGDKQADLIIYNGSFHYSDDFAVTLREALRVLKPTGRLIIMDSPIYSDPDSGRQMVDEREAYFEQRYGFASNSIASENYLTHQRLDELGRELNLYWERLEPFYGLRWAIRPLKARLRGRREPARFMLLIARRQDQKNALHG